MEEQASKIIEFNDILFEGCQIIPNFKVQYLAFKAHDVKERLIEAFGFCFILTRDLQKILRQTDFLHLNSMGCSAIQILLFLNYR